MGRSNLFILGGAAALMLIGVDLDAQKVTTNFNSPFDFANHKKYSWAENHIVTRQGRPNDILIDQKIVQDVNRNLAGKGFFEDSSAPDFLISYEAGASDFAADVEGAHAAPAPRWNEPQNPVYGIPQNIWYSVDGHITFRLVNAKSKQPVWTASVTKKVRDPHKGMKDMEKQVEQIVSKAFRSFPPPRGN